MTAPRSTRVTVLTPPGRAAVAVILVEGPQALSTVGAALVCKRGGRITDAPIGQVMVGHWATLEGEEVVVCRRSAEAIEVHCHGGKAAVEAIVGSLSDGGWVRSTWQDAIRIGAPDSICAAARIALAEAPTSRTAAILLDQFEGALRGAVDRIESAVAVSDWCAAISRLDSIFDHRRLGLHLTQPWRVVIAGRPNVGKSSLLNALLGFERAIVYDLPGTTRDVVTANTAIDGWPVVLADTAGLREATDSIEIAGVERASTAVADADLVLLVVDTLDAREIELPVEVPVLRVLNKMDLHPAIEPHDRQRYDACVSAKLNTGIAELLGTIGHSLVSEPPAPGEAVAFTAAQFAALDAARQAIERHDLQAAQGCLQSLFA